MKRKLREMRKGSKADAKGKGKEGDLPPTESTSTTSSTSSLSGSRMTSRQKALQQGDAQGKKKKGAGLWSLPMGMDRERLNRCR